MGMEIRSWMGGEKRRRKLERRYRRRRALFVTGAFGTGFADIFLTTAMVANDHPIRGAIFAVAGFVIATGLGVGAKKAGNKLEDLTYGRD